MNVRPAQDAAIARAHLVRACARDVLGLSPAVDDLVADDYLLWDVADETGKAVAAMAVGVHDYTDGRIVRCSAAGGAPGFDLVPTMAGFLDAHARAAGARLITCETARPGLVRRLRAHGYEVGGFILRKAVA